MKTPAKSPGNTLVTTSARTPVAQIKKLSKNYVQANLSIQVLKDLEFEIYEGETVAILGQSGTGKSTLLSLLAGLDRPSEGEIYWDGTNINQLDERALTQFRAKTLGIVFQQFHLMSYLNASENVSLPLEIASVAQAEQKANQALTQVGLQHRLHHLPQQLSGGEKQRVAIARAFVVQPKLLLADEPSGSLDPKTGEEVLDLLFRQVKQTQMAMVLVTHNQELAAQCDRQLHLKEGKLV